MFHLMHLLYVIAFTILAFLAIGNLLRNLMVLGADSRTGWSTSPRSSGSSLSRTSHIQFVPHPEFLDDKGHVINEPLLIMRSMTVEDAREQLDALYNSSPANNSNDSAAGV